MKPGAAGDERLLPAGSLGHVDDPSAGTSAPSRTSWRWPSSSRRPTPTSRSASGRSVERAVEEPHASSPRRPRRRCRRGARSTGCGWRSPGSGPSSSRCAPRVRADETSAARRDAIARSSSWRRSRSATSRGKVSSDADRDRARGRLERARVDAAGTVAQQPSQLPWQLTRSSSGSVSAARPPASRSPSARSRSSVRGPIPGSSRSVERREESGLAARAHDRHPSRLAPVARDLRDDLRGADAERARERSGAAHGRLHRLGDDAGVRKVGADLASVEEALVEPRALDGGHDAAHGLPDGAASSRGRRHAADGRTRHAGSCGALPRGSSPSGSRTAAPRSSRSRRRRGPAGRRRRPAPPAQLGVPAPRPRRRRHPGRGARRSHEEAYVLSETWGTGASPRVPPPSPERLIRA